MKKRVDNLHWLPDNQPRLEHIFWKAERHDVINYSAGDATPQGETREMRGLAMSSPTKTNSRLAGSTRCSSLTCKVSGP